MSIYNNNNHNNNNNNNINKTSTGSSSSSASSCYISSINNNNNINSKNNCLNESNRNRNRTSCSSSTDENENEPLDPRIQGELERLNKSCADINKMENELEEAKQLFTTSKNRQLQRLEFLQKKLGACIVKSKPFYEAFELTEKLQLETQKAVHEFQKANSLYKTAKETLSVAEHSLVKGEIPSAWQEHLSATITKINLSKKAADQAEENHRHKAIEYQQAELKCQYLEKDLKRQIAKSKLYYEEKSRWNIQMDAHKQRIHELEQALIQTKAIYKEAMLNLSKISEEIHNKRKYEKIIKELPPREPGVGAEKPNEFGFVESSMSPILNLDRTKSNESQIINNDHHKQHNHNQDHDQDEDDDQQDILVEKNLKNYLTRYNLALPNREITKQTSSTNGLDLDYESNNSPNTTKNTSGGIINSTKLIDDVFNRSTSLTSSKNTTNSMNDSSIDLTKSLEYVSLGLNSTASNSHSTSRSNSIDNDEWKERVILQNGNQLNQTLSTKLEQLSITSSKTPSFSSSSISRDSTDQHHQQHQTRHSITNPKTPSYTENLGIININTQGKQINENKKSGSDECLYEDTSNNTSKTLSNSITKPINETLKNSKSNSGGLANQSQNGFGLTSSASNGAISTSNYYLTTQDNNNKSKSTKPITPPTPTTKTTTTTSTSKTTINKETPLLSNLLYQHNRKF